MKWKIWFAVFLVIAIVGLMFLTQQGIIFSKLVGNTLSGFLSSFGVKIPGLPSLPGFPTFTGGEGFSMTVSMDKNALNNNVFTATNSVMLLDGLCVRDITLGGTLVKKLSESCKVEIYNSNGRIDFSGNGNLIVSVSSPLVNVDGKDIAPSKGTFDVSLELVPSNLSILGISNAGLSLKIQNGEATKLNSDGSIRSLENLYNETIQINNFIGSIVLKNSDYLLRGLSTQIKGETFNWY